MIFSNFFQMFLEFILGVQRYFWNPQKVFCAQNIFLTRFRALTDKKIFHSKLEFREPPPIVNTVIDIPPRGGGRGSRHDRNRIQKCVPRSFFTSLNTLKHFQNVLERFGDVRGHFNHYDFLCNFPLHHYTGFTQELGIDRFKYLF